jgi:hypothetical protein
MKTIGEQFGESEYDMQEMNQCDKEAALSETLHCNEEFYFSYF